MAIGSDGLGVLDRSGGKAVSAGETAIAATERPAATTAYPSPLSRGGDNRRADHTDRVALGRYLVVEEIGRGGMGRVVRAYDPKLQREVAIKQILHEVFDESALARFSAEARAMAALSHPNVVAIYDVAFDVDCDVAIVMELVRGTTLAGWLAQESRTAAEIIDRFTAAGRGLAAAHAAGVLHRDFKPGNVLVGTDGATKVTDFGLAKLSHVFDGDDRITIVYGTGCAAASKVGEQGDLIPGAIARDNNSVSGVTATGTIVGTPLYMAPEQHWGDASTPAADQYSFCVALWEALCAAPPFEGQSLAVRKQEGPPPWPNVEVPQRVVPAIVRGLAPEAGDRWPSMDDLLAELSLVPRRGSSRVSALVAVAATAAIFGGGVALLGATRAQKCSGAESEMSAIWDPQRRQKVDSAISGLVPDGRDNLAHIAKRTTASIDDYARHWVEQHRSVCEATSVRGDQSAAVMDLRMECLQRAKRSLRATLDILQEPDAALAYRAHQMIDALPTLADCDDVDELRRDRSEPPAQEVEKVELIRDELGRAQAELVAGRYTAGFERAKAAQVEAEQLTSPTGQCKRRLP